MATPRDIRKEFLNRPKATGGHGAVIIFNERLTPAQMEDALAILRRKGVIASDTGVREYNPEYGGPVWYIP